MTDGWLHLTWVLFGVLGQVVFGLRFVVQWLASERRGRSTVPDAFWYLSLAGGVMLFVYACFYRRDPVFTLGQGAGILIYTRNLVLNRRARGGGPPVVAAPRQDADVADVSAVGSR